MSPSPRRLSPSSASALAALAVLAGACGDGNHDAPRAPALLHHDDPAAAKIDLAAARAQPAALVAALTAPPDPLGGFTLIARQRTQVLDGQAEVYALDVEDRLRLDAAGQYLAARATSDGQAREVRFVGGLLYLAVGPPALELGGGDVVAGKLHRRAPTSPDEPRTYKQDTFGAFGQTFALVAPWATLGDGGEVEAARRPGQKITLGLASKRTPLPAPRTPLPQQAWRDSLTVTALSGEVVLDRATGLPLAAQLEAKGTFVRDGKTFTLVVSASHELAGTEGSVNPPLPEQVADTPPRTREVEERERLLEGLAAPARRGPAAGAEGKP